MGGGAVSEYDYRETLEAEFLAGVDAFDRSYFERFGRFPEESGLTVESVRNAGRRQRIATLAEQGATAGERAAAQAALERIDHSDRMSRLDREAENR